MYLLKKLLLEIFNNKIHGQGLSCTAASPHLIGFVSFKFTMERAKAGELAENRRFFDNLTGDTFPCDNAFKIKLAVYSQGIFTFLL